MRELVLKREANVTSAEALDEIAFNYPEAEILSFRKIQETGEDKQFFITRVRMAAQDNEEPMADDKDEDKLDQILDIVKEILKAETEEPMEETEELAEELPAPIDTPSAAEEHTRRPLPPPQKPVIPSGSTTQLSPIASILVERVASVPKKVARIELLREFGKEYSIRDLKKIGNVYQASLVRLADLDDDIDADSRYDALALQEIQDQKRREQEFNRFVEEYYSPETEDEAGRSLKAEEHFDYDDPQYNLSPWAKKYMQFLDESGMAKKGIKLMMDWFGSQSAEQQGAFVRGMMERSSLPGSPKGLGDDSALKIRNLKQPRDGRFTVPKQLEKFMRGEGPKGVVQTFEVDPALREELKSMRDQKAQEQQQLAEAADERYPADLRYPQRWFDYAVDAISRVEGEENQRKVLNDILTGQIGIKEPRQPRPSADIDISGMTLLDLARQPLTPGQAYKAFKDMSQLNRTQQLRVPAPQEVETPAGVQKAPHFFGDQEPAIVEDPDKGPTEVRTYPATR